MTIRYKVEKNKLKQWGMLWVVMDGSLDAIICYCPTNTVAADICEALNQAVERRILTGEACQGCGITFPQDSVLDMPPENPQSCVDCAYDED